MSANGSSDRLRILHCMRAPVGGLFRHVRDLAKVQAEAGHAVGILCDASTGGPTAETVLAELKPLMQLGIRRIAMSRQFGIADYQGYGAAVTMGAEQRVDVLHGHGGKGGAYARLAARTLKQRRQNVTAVYTPHGGTLHYRAGSPVGLFYLGLEKVLTPITDGIIFESAYSQKMFAEKIGSSVVSEVIPNGLRPDEFYQHHPDPNGFDFLFVGEMRHLKGVDVLLSALAHIRKELPVRALLVGDGPDRSLYAAQALALGLSDAVEFAGIQPARAAFQRANILIVPSRAESFPYIVLEGAAACKPLIATAVGGIPEIVAGTDTQLIAPGSTDELAAAMRFLRANADQARARAEQLQSSVLQRFTIAHMAQSIEAFYYSRRVY